MKIIIKQGTPSSESGPDLMIDVSYNTKLEDALFKLNTFRAPDSQINKLYNRHGKELDIRIPLRGDVTAYTMRFS